MLVARRLATFALLVACLPGAAQAATDHYVDIASGVDVPGGGTLQAPWKTIAYALSQVGAPGDRILVAPGVHDAAAGEVFPLEMRSGVSIEGSGIGQTVLRGAGRGTGTDLVSYDVSAVNPPGFVENARLAHMTLEQNANGANIEVAHLSVPPCRPVFSGLELRDLDRGIRVVGTDPGFTFGGTCDPLVSGCRFEACGTAVCFGCADVPFTSPPLAVRGSPVVEDCTFMSCDVGSAFVANYDQTVNSSVLGCRFESCMLGTSSDEGLHLVTDSVFEQCGTAVFQGPAGFVFGPAGLYMDRCVLLGSTVRGLAADGGSVKAYNSLIADGATGVWGYGLDVTSNSVFSLDHVTVTGNDFGVEGIGQVSFRLDNSILWGNGSECEPPGGSFGGPCEQLLQIATFSDISTPGAPPVGTNLDVDPLFVDPAGGDYRLDPNSPLVDAGAPGWIPSTLQERLDGDLDPRILDGDQDLTARTDIGWDEYNPVALAVTGAPQLGATVTLDLAAPLGWFPIHGLALGTADVGLGALGSLLLDPLTLVVLWQFAGQTQYALALPPNPALEGLEVSLQSVALELVTTAGSTSNRVDLLLE